MSPRRSDASSTPASPRSGRAARPQGRRPRSEPARAKAAQGARKAEGRAGSRRRAEAGPRKTGERRRAPARRANGGGPLQDGRAKAWIDGAIVDADQARVPVTDHGLLYGDGIFEGIRVFAGRVFRLDDHLARFAASAQGIGLSLPGGLARVRGIVLKTVRAYGEAEAYVRLIATRGAGALGLDPASCPEPRLICLVGQVAIYPEEKLRRGIDLVTVSLRRPPADVLDPRVKSLNYLNNVLAKLEARQRGADEALLLNLAGMVAETSVANVFVFRGGELATPPGSDGALEGITRATLLELAAMLGIPAREKSLGRFDLFAAEEVLLSGSGAGVVPVRSLDGREIGGGRPGPGYAKLRAAFADAAPALGTPAVET